MRKIFKTSTAGGYPTMGKILQNKDVRVSLIFTLIGFIASLFAAMYQVSVFSQNIKQQIITQLGSIEALYAVAAL